MTRVQAQTRPLGEHGREWIRCIGIKISDGMPRVRREPETPEECRVREAYALRMQQAMANSAWMTQTTQMQARRSYLPRRLDGPER